MNKILVTGGSGFIGSHTCFYLLSEGYDIYVIDSLVNSSIKSLEKIKEIFRKENKDITNHLTFFRGDLRNKEFLNSIFENAIKENNPIKGVIHFAGLKGHTEIVKKLK